MPYQDPAAFFGELMEPANPRVKRMALDTVDAPSNEQSVADSQAGLLGHQVIAFTSNLSAEYKQAVKNSTQLAQIAADRQSNHITDRHQWYEHYVQALKKCGWLATESKLTNLQTSQFELTMEELVLELVKVAAGPNALLIAEVTQAAIGALKNDDAKLSKLQHASSSSETGAFDILPCLQRGDDVVMYNHTLTFKQQQSSGGFWFWSWQARETDLKHASNELTLNYEAYKRAEEHILKVIGNDSSTYFDSLLS